MYLGALCGFGVCVEGAVLIHVRETEGSNDFAWTSREQNPQA